MEFPILMSVMELFWQNNVTIEVNEDTSILVSEQPLQTKLLREVQEFNPDMVASKVQPGRSKSVQDVHPVTSIEVIDTKDVPVMVTIDVQFVRSRVIIGFEVNTNVTREVSPLTSRFVIAQSLHSKSFNSVQPVTTNVASAGFE